MKKKPIGIFDSGIGGLTIAHAIKQKLNNEDIIYFGDTKHLPYGEKSESAIQEFSIKISNFLINKNCKAIIIACNSASSVAYDHVKNISGNIPVFNVIDPVIKTVVTNYNNSKIGVIGTKATIKSNVYPNKILEQKKSQKVFSLATPLLAPMIEEGFINQEISKMVIENYLGNPILQNIDNLILACTHYPLIEKEIKQFYKGNVKLVDSANIISKFVHQQLEQLNLLNGTSSPRYYFYVSNYTKAFEQSARFFFKEKIRLQEVDLD